MDDALGFRIGGSNREHVIVHPTRRERPEASDYLDGNWVYANVKVAARAFRGEFEAQLRAEEFVRFRDELHVVYETLKGSAKFETIAYSGLTRGLIPGHSGSDSGASGGSFRGDPGAGEWRRTQSQAHRVHGRDVGATFDAEGTGSF